MSFLVLDAGTSAVKAALCTDRGLLLGVSRRPIAVRRPMAGWAELEPDAVWRALVLAGRQALVAAAGAEPVRAVGVSALLGHLFLDRRGEPLAPAVIWMDRRAAAEAAQIARRLPEALLWERTGRRPAVEHLAPRLLWLRANRPGLARRVRTVIGLKDELVRRLTGGELATDFAHLDYTLLFDIRRRRIDPEIASALDIDPALFPAARPATEVVGALGRRAAARLGLPPGLPVVCGSSDGTTAMYGGGVLVPGAAVLVSGTTDVLMTACRRPPTDPTRRLTVNTGMLPGLYLAGGATGLSGGAVGRLEELLGVSAGALGRRIARLPPGADGLTVLPGLTGERAPFWFAEASGGILGLGPGHGPEHILAAAMEATAFRLARLLAIMAGAGLQPARLHAVGGAAASRVWNGIRCDVLGIPLLRSKTAEATLIGTAMFCRAAVDGAALADTAARWLAFDRPLAPRPGRRARYRALAAAFEERLKTAALPTPVPRGDRAAGPRRGKRRSLP